MKRIVHISTVHTPFDQRIFHRECVTLANAGYDVSLLAFGDIEGTSQGVKMISLGKDNERKVGMNLLVRARRIRRAMAHADGMNADLYHFHDPELIGTGIALKNRLCARVVYDCHEDNVAYMKQKKYIPALLRIILAEAIRRQELHAASRLDAIVTADEGMRQYFSALGAIQTISIDNFPRLELFLSSADDVEKNYDLVYHGTISRYHLETCFAVDSHLVKMGLRPRWLFIGKCPELNWARGEVEKRKAEERIFFKGMVPHEQIARWVRLGRIGIIPLPDYPKFQRNIPTKLFEFMALKMPVVMSDLPPSRPFVGDGMCAILVDPDQPADYARAIAKLLCSHSRREEMGAEGYRRVISKYNWEVSGGKMLKLYKELLCPGSSSVQMTTA